MRDDFLVILNLQLFCLTFMHKCRFVLGVITERPGFVLNVISLLDDLAAVNDQAVQEVARQYIGALAEVLIAIPCPPSGGPVPTDRFKHYLPLVHRIISERSIDPTVYVPNNNRTFFCWSKTKQKNKKANSILFL